MWIGQNFTKLQANNVQVLQKQNLKKETFNFTKIKSSLNCKVYNGDFFQSNTQDQILLQWEGGDSATMHVLVVHAMIILLTYGPPNGKL